MKFKMQDKQNQLIERISDKHLVFWGRHCPTNTCGTSCKL